MYKFIDNQSKPATPLTVLIMNHRGEDVTEKYIPIHIVDREPRETDINSVKQTEKGIFRTCNTGHLRAFLTGSFEARAEMKGNKLIYIISGGRHFPDEEDLLKMG